MTMARIRRLVLKIVTAWTADAVSPLSSASVAPSTARASVAAGTDGPEEVFNAGRIPWAAGMAPPSFVILSARPRR